MNPESKPKETLSILDAVSIIVGVVVGIGIFKTPSIVAASADSETMLVLFWLMGGAASFIGALCYAELASTYPHAGGDYHYLHKAFGNIPSFLYAWARMAVIQTGSIAMVAFLIGDYASEILTLGPYSTSVYAALTIILLTAVNIAGIRQGKSTQKLLIIAIISGLFIVASTGFFLAEPQAAQNTGKIMPGKAALGTAMIFVLLTYGGWNEAAFLSAEVRSTKRNMVRVLLYSIVTITVIYLLVNLALLNSLGLKGMAKSDAVMADLMRNVFGAGGVVFISLLIILAALSTINAAIITGARSGYALGHDYPLLGFLGRWQGKRNTPVNALIVQGGIALLLVLLGTGTRDGFVMMVEYTAPVFWFFLLMVGVSIFVLRSKKEKTKRAFSAPLYPFTPLLFCVISAFMLYSSIMYTSSGSLVGVAVLLSGIPLLLLNR
ncbi:MAG: amino acid permease [Syntrophaceae bacterium]|nr:amino acid permease [Syntrophaceae bacterium]